MSSSKYITKEYMQKFSISEDNIRYFFDNLYKMNILYYEPFLLAWAYYIYMTEFEVALNEEFPILKIKNFTSKYLSDQRIINTIETKSIKSMPKSAAERKQYLFRTRTTLIRYYEGILTADREHTINMEDDEYEDEEEDVDNEYEIVEIIDEDVNEDTDYYGEDYIGQYDLEDIGNDSNDMTTGMAKIKG